MRKSSTAFILIAFFLFMLCLAFGFRIDRRANEHPLVGQAFPSFNQKNSLKESFTQKMLQGHLTLWHVWATWCHTCEAEWSMIKAHQGDVYWVSMVYQDTVERVNKWSKVHGNPFNVTLMDLSGNLAFDLGVTGVPETFLIDKQGIIRAKWEGPLSPQRWENDVGPMILKIKKED